MRRGHLCRDSRGRRGAHNAVESKIGRAGALEVRRYEGTGSERGCRGAIVPSTFFLVNRFVINTIANITMLSLTGYNLYKTLPIFMHGGTGHVTVYWY